MKNINTRCPLSAECGKKKCEYEKHELECGYYSTNARPDFEIADQEALRWNGNDDAGLDLEAPEDGRLVYLHVSEIFPHPNNPRRNLGDLTELADSIKVNGVLQNLTVVRGHTISLEEHIAMCKMEGVSKTSAEGLYDPESSYVPDGYTVIIGHRRLAAAKLAGEETVPCVVTALTPEEQVKTMLMENIQRSDLTVYEQAQGFQMMLNMGETVESIAKDTGFSTTTVRRRVKLLDLDAEKFKKSEARGATLRDYIELDKIEDLELKNKVLDTIGTDNFQNALKTAIEVDKLKRRLIEWEAVVSTFATKIEKRGKVGEDTVPMTYAANYHRWNQDRDVEIPSDADSVKYYYTIDSKEIYVYREVVEETHIVTDEERRRRERNEASNKLEKRLEEISTRHFNLRKAFVSGFQATKKRAREIMGYAVKVLIDDDGIDTELFCDILGLDFDEENMTIDDLLKLLNESEIGPETQLLAAAYSSTDIKSLGYHYKRWGDGCYEFIYKENETLDSLYDFLISLGYDMSDEEKAMRDGTHEVFGESSTKEDAQ